MKQITIVTEDRPGILAEISEALGAAGVNIEELDAEAVGGTSIIIMQVDRYDAALQALAGTPFKAITEDAIVVQVDDRAGELAHVARRFKDANLNLRSLRIIRRWAGKSFIAIAADRTDEVMALVKDILVS